MWIEPCSVAWSDGAVEDGFVDVGGVVCEFGVHVGVDLCCKVVLFVLAVVLCEVGPRGWFGVVVEVGLDSVVCVMELSCGVWVCRVEVVVRVDVDMVGVVEIRAPTGDVSRRNP